MTVPPFVRTCGLVSRLCGSPCLLSRAPRRLASHYAPGAGITLPIEGADVTSRTRNIGIIAHIDAGKTTTTERMLYYAGYNKRLGSVDEGSTTTDFLPLERKRGITIQSAAITFHWPPAQDSHSGVSEGGHPHGAYIVNLIDTPGHADFTFEVVRSLRVLDGAVCILDGVAGVEAQTEQVWRQAREYQVPKIIYVNKLDRVGAAFGTTVRDIASRLQVWPAVCQIPWYAEKGEHFQGVVDLIRLRGLKWPSSLANSHSDHGDGKLIEEYSLEQLSKIDAGLAEEAQRARIALIELLSEHDESMVDKFLEHNEDHLAIPSLDVFASLRTCTIHERRVVPIFAGASYRNIGVQPLLDAITMLLPNPSEAPDPDFKSGDLQAKIGDIASGRFQDLALTREPTKKVAKHHARPHGVSKQDLQACALAFKVVYDGKNFLVYVRVYHGSLRRNSLLFNTSLRTVEKAPRLHRMYASDPVEIDEIPAGQIGVVPNLKHARTGDTLIACTGLNPKSGAGPPWDEMQLRPIEVPPPVFFAGVEPASGSEETNVREALQILLREDPSLRLSKDEDTGQQLLSGMGELHLEIAQDRLLHGLRAKAVIGPIEIGYRECIAAAAGPCPVTLERETRGKLVAAGCAAKVTPLTEVIDRNTGDHVDSVLERDNNLIQISVKRSEEAPSAPIQKVLPGALHPEAVFHAMQSGALAALARGPQHRFAIHGTLIRLRIDPEKDIFGEATSLSILSAVSRAAVGDALRESNQTKRTGLVEPVMHVVVSVDEQSFGTVMHDISSTRSGHILGLDEAVEKDGRGLKDEAMPIDLSKVYSPPDPFRSDATSSHDDDAAAASQRSRRTIVARVPLREMVGYMKHLRSLTQGRGNFVMRLDSYDRMQPQKEKMVVKQLKGVE